MSRAPDPPAEAQPTPVPAPALRIERRKLAHPRLVEGAEVEALFQEHVLDLACSSLRIDPEPA